jgi:hypothetical protein
MPRFWRVSVPRLPGESALTALAAAIGLALAMLLGPLTGIADAATPAVTTTADGGAGSLRAAVLAASASGRATVIDVPPGVYALTRCGVDDAGAAGDLDLATAAGVTLRASSGAVTIRQTCAGERVLQARGGGRLTLERITLTGGRVVGRAGGEAQGGGVWAQGDVVLDHSTITGNSALGGDGANAAATSVAPGDGGNARGGGLWVGGRLVSTGSTLSANAVHGGAGGDTAPGSTRTGGAGGAAEGGGVYVVGAVVTAGGLLSANTATGGIGGAADGTLFAPDDTVAALYPGGAGGAARGGAVAQATSSSAPVGLAGVRTSANVASGGTIGAYRSGLVTSPKGVVWPPAGSADGGAVAAAGPLAAFGLASAGDRANGGDSALSCGYVCDQGPASGAAHGGSLQAAGSAAVARSTFAGTAATGGEAFFIELGHARLAFGWAAGVAAGGAVDAGANLALAGATVRNAVARNGVGFPRSPTAALGGAAHAHGALTVTGGSFTGNTVGRAVVDIFGGVGGALAGGTVRLAGVTLTSNTAAAAGGGAWSSGSLTMTDTTLNANQGGAAGGGARADGDLTATRAQVVGNEVAGDIRPLNGKLQPGTGGGLDAGGAMRLTGTAVTGNIGDSTLDSGSGYRLNSGFQGAGVWARSLVASASTISGNTMPRALDLSLPDSARIDESTGAGIFAVTTAELVNTTVSDNSMTRILWQGGDSTNRAGGVSAAALRLVQATLTGNAVRQRATDGSDPTLAPDGGTAQSPALTAVGSVLLPVDGQRSCVAGTAPAGTSSYDVLGDATCGLRGTGVRTSALGTALGPVRDNGGPAPTQLPAAGSTLIDAEPTSACSAATDARGVPRPQGPACDIGAVEVRR